MLMSASIILVGLASLTRTMAPAWKNTPEEQERTQLCYIDIFNINQANFEAVKMDCENEADFDETMFWHKIKKMGKRHPRKGKRGPKRWPEPESEREHWPEPEGEGEHWPEPEGEGEHWPEPEGEREHWPESEGEGEHWPEPEGEGEHWPEPESEREHWAEPEGEGEHWPEPEGEGEYSTEAQGESEYESEQNTSEECNDEYDSSSEESNEDEHDKMRKKMKMKCRRRMRPKHRRPPPPSYASYKKKIGKATKLMKMKHEKFEMCKGKKMGYLNNDNILSNEALKSKIQEAAADNEPLRKQLLDRLDACVDEEIKLFYLCMKMGCKHFHKTFGKKYKCVEY